MIISWDMRQTRTKHYRFVDVEDAPEIVMEVFAGEYVNYRPVRVILVRTEGKPTYSVTVRAKSRSGYDMSFDFATEEQYETHSVKLAPPWVLRLIAEDLW